MKIVFSRKGFDSGSGGVPSPIIDGRPTSIPIPTRVRSETTYDDLGLGIVVEQITRGRLNRASLCHHDPMFEGARCAFGQTGAAQGHLANNGGGVGEVFLFFGLFASMDGGDPHHRTFGYLNVEEAIVLGSEPPPGSQPRSFPRRHPHTLTGWNPNNTIYSGPGRTCIADAPELRLSLPGGPISRWAVPKWLSDAGLTYHRDPVRWRSDDTLEAVARGQEFVSDVTGCPDATMWLDHVLSLISNGPVGARTKG